MKMSISQWLTKYKIFYVLAWMIVSFILMFISYDSNTSILPQWIGYLVVTGSAIPVCWYTANKLIPGYLYQRKIGKFLSYLLIFTLLNAILTYLAALFIY